jgi:hypothetical protein
MCTVLLPPGVNLTAFNNNNNNNNPGDAVLMLQFGQQMTSTGVINEFMGGKRYTVGCFVRSIVCKIMYTDWWKYCVIFTMLAALMIPKHRPFLSNLRETQILTG